MLLAGANPAPDDPKDGCLERLHDAVDNLVPLPFRFRTLVSVQVGHPPILIEVSMRGADLEPLRMKLEVLVTEHARRLAATDVLAELSLAKETHPFTGLLLLSENGVAEVYLGMDNWIEILGVGHALDLAVQLIFLVLLDQPIDVFCDCLVS